MRRPPAATQAASPLTRDNRQESLTVPSETIQELVLTAPLEFSQTAENSSFRPTPPPSTQNRLSWKEHRITKVLYNKTLEEWYPPDQPHLA